MILPIWFGFFGTASAVCPAYMVTDTDGSVKVMSNKLTFTAVDETTINYMPSISVDETIPLPIAALHYAAAWSTTNCPLVITGVDAVIHEQVVSGDYIVSEGYLTPDLYVGDPVFIEGYFRRGTFGASVMGGKSGVLPGMVRYPLAGPREGDIVVAFEKWWFWSDVGWEFTPSWQIMLIFASSSSTAIEGKVVRVTYTDGYNTVTVTTGASYGYTYTIP